MKRTFTANISGIIFHIDEDAFDVLGNYLNTIKNSFSQEEGRDEIIADIEARIAELLQEKVTPNKQVITLEDVQQIMKIMGNASDFNQNDNATEEKSNEGKTTANKRFYRDPDGKILGGVCAGIAAYFNIDPLWIRLAFVVAALLYSTGFFLYLILWMIVPMARTTAEKLEMKGEQVNVSNIKKTIKEELKSVKEKFKEVGAESNDLLKNSRKKIPHTPIEKFINLLFQILKHFVKTVAIVIGLFFIIIGLFLLIGLLSSFINSASQEVIWISSFGISSFSIPAFLKIFLASSTLVWMSMLGIFLFIGIPLIMLIYNGIKMVFGFKTRYRIIGITSFSLWLAGLVICVVVILKIASNYAVKTQVTKKITLVKPSKRTVYLKVYNPFNDDIFENNKQKIALGSWNMIQYEDKKFTFGMPDLRIVKSESDSMQIILHYQARGSSHESAKKAIQHIAYQVKQQDTILTLDKFFMVPTNDYWRNQRLKIIFKLPVNRNIYIDNELEDLLSNNEFFSGAFDSNIPGKKWTMTANGLQESRTIIVDKSDSLKLK